MVDSLRLLQAKKTYRKSLAGLSILLDTALPLWYMVYRVMRKFSTAEAAKMLGLHRPHLQRAIAQGRVRPPRLIRVGGASARLWTDKDVERARKALKKRKA